VQLEGSGVRGVGPKVIGSAVGDGGGGDDAAAAASCVGPDVRSEQVCLVQIVVRQG